MLQKEKNYQEKKLTISNKTLKNQLNLLKYIFQLF